MDDTLQGTPYSRHGTDKGLPGILLPQLGETAACRQPARCGSTLALRLAADAPACYGTLPSMPIALSACPSGQRAVWTHVLLLLESLGSDYPVDPNPTQPAH